MLDSSSESLSRFVQQSLAEAKAPKRKNIGDAFALRGIAVCGGCDASLRSSISRGNGGQYHYYLCQTKACEHYGKSTKRDVLEGEVGAIIRQLQPTGAAVRLLTDMLRKAWDARHDQASDHPRRSWQQDSND
ncbi:MAG: zinc ribbon domain-containing protein [Pseudomonadota bacterium]